MHDNSNRDENRSKLRRDIGVDLDLEDDFDADKAYVSDQGGEWRPALGKRWRRQVRTRRLTSSSQDGNPDEYTDHDADEAESHQAIQSTTT